MDAAREYALERSQREYERLALQGEIFKPMTRRFFEEAGIGPGMRVVDLGSGAGDVCLLLAEMVGPSGDVIGLEIDKDANRFAADRARGAGHRNIQFVAADVAHYTSGSPIDAVVGRCILMYQPDPAATLAGLVRHLRSGGSAAFMEPWFFPPAGPDSMMKKAGMVIYETLRLSGAHTDLGPRLHKVFSDSGLPLPHMRFESVLDSHEDSPLNEYFLKTVAHFLPKALEYGVIKPEEIDPVTLAEGIRAERTKAGYATFGPPLILAWSRKK